jgi:hypothetical protein
MMFTKRNERDLSEVKELAYEPGKGAQEALERLGRINELQQRQLATRGRWRDDPMFARAYSKAGVHAGEKILTRPDPALPK